MLNLEEIRIKIQEFERRQEEIDDYKSDLDEDLNVLAEDDERFKTNNADVLINGSQNPVKIQRENKERAFLLLDERDKELDELSDEITEIEKKLNQEIDEFIKETIEKIQEEKNRINKEVQEPEISLNRLNDEKQKMESEKKRLSELIELAESRKVRADDSIYKDLKRREKNAISRIDEINKELKELEPDKLSDLWDELDGYEKNIEALKGSSKEKIDTLTSVFDVKKQEPIKQETSDKHYEKLAEQLEQQAKREEEEETRRKAEEAKQEEARRKAEKEHYDKLAKQLQEQAKREVEEEARRKAEKEHYEKLAKQLEEQAKREEGEEAKHKVADDKGRKTEENGDSKTGDEAELDKIEEALEELADQEARKDKEERADQILQETIEGMDEDLGSSVSKFQEPNNDKIGGGSKVRTGITPSNPSDIEPPKKSDNSSSKSKNEITMSSEKYSNYLYEHMIKKDKEFEIEIGETVVIYKDEEPLKPETLKSYKKAAKLNEKYEKDGISAFSKKTISELKYISEDVLDIIKDCSDNKVPIDFMVIFAIKDNEELSNTEKYSLMYDYLVSNLKAYYNYSKFEKSEDDIAETLSKYEKFETQDNLLVSYNMNELSGAHLSDLLPMSNKLNKRQKEQTANLANKFQRLGTAITRGQYNPNKKSRIANTKPRITNILNWKPFKKVKQLLLPAPEKMETPDYDTPFKYEKTMISEEELEAAYRYNEERNNVRNAVKLSPEELEKVETAAKARAEEFRENGDTKKADKLEELANAQSQQTKNQNSGTDRE